MEALDSLPAVREDADDAAIREAEALMAELDAGNARDRPDLVTVPSLLGRNVRRRLDMWTGELFRSGQQCLYMRQCKEAKRLKRKIDDKQRSHESLESAWNEERLRSGDRVGEHMAKQAHPNKFESCGVLRQAWLQHGGGRTLRVGIDGQHRELALISTLSSAIAIDQSKWVKQQVERLKNDKCPFALFHNYDASPRSFAFGRLQAMLQPLARYPYWDGSKWRCVPLDEYLKLVPGRKVLNRGVLDIFAHTVRCRFSALDGTDCGFKVLVPPRVLSDGTASCILDAMEQSVPELSTDAVKELCLHCPYCFISEQPDGCGANQRKQHQSQEYIADVDNAFFD